MNLQNYGKLFTNRHSLTCLPSSATSWWEFKVPQSTREAAHTRTVHFHYAREAQRELLLVNWIKLAPRWKRGQGIRQQMDSSWLMEDSSTPLSELLFDEFLIIKPTRCTNFSNLFLEWNSTCFEQFLCPSSEVFHCTHSNGICHTGLLTACEQDQDGTLFHPDTIAVCTVKNFWRWREELSETCSFIPRIDLRN